MPTTRTQLSLYIPEPIASSLEALRRVVDPVQQGLIPAHVTLCREDELAGLDFEALESRLAGFPPLSLEFGGPEGFSGHGILLPCIAGEDAFQALREQILGSAAIRRQAAHITLAHPRNPKARGNSLEFAESRIGQLVVRFSHIQWIEQNPGEAWRVLRTCGLGDSGEECER